VTAIFIKDPDEIKPMSSAYEELGKMIMYIRKHAFYKDTDIIQIGVLPDNFVFDDEIYTDKFIKVLKLARDAGYYRHNTRIYENEGINYEDVKLYKIIKSISGVQYYPTISFGDRPELWRLLKK